MTGFESLLRWRHPDRGLLAPASFVALAEETGMIVPIGAWALAQACRDARRWLDRYPCVPPWVVTVNLSCRQLEDPELVQRIAHTLRDTRLPPESLMLEITEGALIQDPVAAAAILGHVRALGVRLSIDDFGTGYSSLAYLQDLPVDALKIDRSFVSRPGEGGGREIVRTIVAMAHGMSKEVIAEGVERADQVPWLRELGCDYVQGFLWSPAVAPADAEAFLAWRPAEWM